MIDIKKIENQTEDNCIFVMKNRPNLFRYIVNPSEKVQIVAVSELFSNIKYIENPSDEVCFAAIKSSSLAISLIKNQTREMCILALKINPSCFKFCKVIDDEILDLAINEKFPKSAFNIGYMEQTEELCLKALKLDLGAYFVITNKTDAIYRYYLDNVYDGKSFMIAFNSFRNKTKEDISRLSKTHPFIADRYSETVEEYIHSKMRYSSNLLVLEISNKFYKEIIEAVNEPIISTINLNLRILFNYGYDQEVVDKYGNKDTFIFLLKTNFEDFKYLLDKVDFDAADLEEISGIFYRYDDSPLRMNKHNISEIKKTKAYKESPLLGTYDTEMELLDYFANGKNFNINYKIRENKMSVVSQVAKKIPDDIFISNFNNIYYLFKCLFDSEYADKRVLELGIDGIKKIVSFIDLSIFNVENVFSDYDKDFLQELLFLIIENNREFNYSNGYFNSSKRDEVFYEWMEEKKFKKRIIEILKNKNHIYLKNVFLCKNFLSSDIDVINIGFSAGVYNCLEYYKDSNKENSIFGDHIELDLDKQIEVLKYDAYLLQYLDQTKRLCYKAAKISINSIKYIKYEFFDFDFALYVMKLIKQSKNPSRFEYEKEIIMSHLTLEEKLKLDDSKVPLFLYMENLKDFEVINGLRNCDKNVLSLVEEKYLEMPAVRKFILENFNDGVKYIKDITIKEYYEYMERFPSLDNLVYLPDKMVKQALILNLSKHISCGFEKTLNIDNLYKVVCYIKDKDFAKSIMEYLKKSIYCLNVHFSDVQTFSRILRIFNRFEDASGLIEDLYSISIFNFGFTKLFKDDSADFLDKHKVDYIDLSRFKKIIADGEIEIKKESVELISDSNLNVLYEINNYFKKKDMAIKILNETRRKYSEEEGSLEPEEYVKISLNEIEYEEQKNVLRESPFRIKEIDNKTEELCLIAINADSRAYNLINNPSKFITCYYQNINK